MKNSVIPENLRKTGAGFAFAAARKFIRNPIWFSAMTNKIGFRINLRETTGKTVNFYSAQIFRNDRKKIWALAVILLCLNLASPAHAAEPDAGDKDSSGLPLPRFASLRSGEVNMRTGPGTRYPIEWVYSRKGLPVEIVAEFEIWRRVRDQDGAEGWVHKTELTGKRSAVVIGATRDLLDDADPAAPVLAHLEAGAIGQLISCAPDWCKLKFAGIKGYLRKGEFWGAYPAEKFD